MWRSGLRTPLGLTILLFSFAAFAQHSSGGGGGGSSSGGGGGGSHGGSSSGSSGGSGGGHSSGGSSSHGSSSHSSGGRGSSSGSASSRSGAHGPQSNALHSIHEPNGAKAAPEKRSFFSFLRHPIGKPKPKPTPARVVADLRRPICVHGPCPVCPAGQVHSAGGCTGTAVTNSRIFCSWQDIANGNSCQLQIHFQDDCGWLRMALEREEQSVRTAESAQTNACSAGARQECSDATGAAQSEAGRYRELQSQYQMCRQRSLTTFPVGGARFGFGGYSAELLHDPLQLDLGYQYLGYQYLGYRYMGYH
jgi:hypothetical protein